MWRDEETLILKVSLISLKTLMGWGLVAGLFFLYRILYIDERISDPSEEESLVRLTKYPLDKKNILEL